MGILIVQVADGISGLRKRVYVRSSHSSHMVVVSALSVNF